MVRSLAARFAALLFLLSLLAWFHGIVALTYGVEAFFSALVGYLSLLVGVSRQPSLDSGDWLGVENIRRCEAVFPGARGRGMVCSHAACKRARLLPKWGWILGDE
jgi:hypothetical protein